MANAGKFISAENGEGVLYAYFEARAAQAATEANDTWDTPEGHAVEAAMGYLKMALEAIGYDLNAVEPIYQSFLANRGN